MLNVDALVIDLQWLHLQILITWLENQLINTDMYFEQFQKSKVYKIQIILSTETN